MSTKKKQSAALSVPSDLIEARIRVIRGHKVMLDSDLAELYEVPNKALNQAVNRNPDRFPEDFAFQLSGEEWDFLRSQTVTSRSWGGRRYPPLTFTEQGVAMLSSVLKSKRAALVNVEIMRAFVRLRRVLVSHDELRLKLEQLESKFDVQFRVVFDAFRALTGPESKRKRRIGFTPADE